MDMIVLHAKMPEVRYQGRKRPPADTMKPKNATSWASCSILAWMTTVWVRELAGDPYDFRAGGKPHVL